MKILLISHKHPPSLGGMETQSFHIAKGLKKDHDVTEIIFKGETNRLTYFLALRKKVKKALDEHNFDLIHLNDGLMAFILSWLPSYTQTPIVVTFHGLDLIFPQEKYQKKLTQYQAPHCYAICVSQSTFEKAKEKGFQTSQLVYIDNGVDHDFAEDIPVEHYNKLAQRYQFPYDEDKDFIMVSIGRAVPRKGFSWFIQNVMPKLPDHFKYIVIGPNNVSSFLNTFLKIMPKRLSRFIATLMGFTTDYNEAIKAIESQNLKNRVFFVDKVAFPDLVNLIRGSHLMVMPNIPFEGDMEGFGLVILEANMCEKYVLGANMEGITSAIHNHSNGELIPSQDQAQWVSKILELESDRTRLANLGEQAMNYARNNFGWQKMVKEYIAFFNKIGGKTS